MISLVCLEKNERLHGEVISAPPWCIDVCFIREEHRYPIQKDSIYLLYTTYIVWKWQKLPCKRGRFRKKTCYRANFISLIIVVIGINSYITYLGFGTFLFYPTHTYSLSLFSHPSLFLCLSLFVTILSPLSTNSPPKYLLSFCILSWAFSFNNMWGPSLWFCLLPTRR